MTCPDCNENEMSAADARVLGCCSDCAEKLGRTWVMLDRANGDA